MRFIFSFIFSLTIAACSFSKSKVKDSSLSDKSDQQTISIEDQLVRTALTPDAERFKTAVKSYSISQLNSKWSNEENLLSFLIRLGSSERLKIFLDAGLSPYLPIENQDFLFQDQLDASEALNGAETSVEYKRMEAPITQTQVFATLRDQHNLLSREIYSSLVNNDIPKANFIAKASGISCEPLIYSLLLQFQSDNEHSVSLDKLKVFWQSQLCDMQMLSYARSTRIWLIEIQKQFKLEFNSPALLELLSSKKRAMTYLIPVGNKRILASLRALYAISKICQFKNPMDKTHSDIVCLESENQQHTESREHVTDTYSDRFEIFMKDNPPPLKDPNKMEIGPLREFLDELGFKNVEAFELQIYTEEGAIQWSIGGSKFDYAGSFRLYDFCEQNGTLDRSNFLQREIYKAMHSYPLSPDVFKIKSDL